MNSNVKYVLIYTLLQGISSGIWGYAVLGPYLYVLEDENNSKVGFAEGAQGLAQALAAIPAGYYADKMARDKIMRKGGIAGFLSAAGIIFALWYDRGDHTYPSLVVALMMFGIYRGAVFPALTALFADSLATGNRSKYFTFRFQLILIGSATGPLINIILFQIIGNHWNLHELTTVFTAGVGLGVLPVMILYFFSDEQSLGEASDSVLTRTSRMSMSVDNEPSSNNNTDEEYEEEEEEEISEGKTRRRGSSTVSIDLSNMTPEELALHEKRQRLIAPLIAFSDCLFGLASGMTIKFFPLFFKNEVEMTPTGVNTIYVVSPVVMAIGSQLAQKVSKGVGRMPVTIFFKLIGISLLFFMSAVKSYWQHVWLMVPVYIARTVCMNMTYPLVRSILMDYVDKDRRAKWNSVESITSFGWSGSAMLGGWLTDHYGYEVTFLTTASTQAVAMLPLFYLSSLVPRLEVKDLKEIQEEIDIEGGNKHDINNNNSSNNNYNKNALTRHDKDSILDSHYHLLEDDDLKETTSPRVGRAASING